MSKGTKKTFFQGALILTGAIVISKLLGAVFRIPLTNVIGAEGGAYYSAVYYIYTLLLTLSIAGYPVAISRMVSERLTFGDHYGAHRVFRISLCVMCTIGVVSTIVMFVCAKPFADSLKDLEGAVYGMRAIAPALFFVPIMSAFMGYFQGMRNMRPSAAVQIVEQLFRVVVGLALSFFLISKGEEYAAAGATFGATAGTFAGLLLIFFVYLAKVRKPHFREQIAESKLRFAGREQSCGKILASLFAITIPIMIGASIMPIMGNIDLVMVSHRLSDAGWDPEEVRSMYGQLTTMASPIVALPQAITQSIAVSLVPTVISAFKLRDHEFLDRNISLSMRMSLIISLPCSVGVITLAEPIMRLLYPFQEQDAIAAAPGLRVLAIGIVFLTLIQTFTGVLQGVERQMKPVLFLFVGACVKAALTYILTGIKAVNILGAAGGTAIAYIIASVLDYLAVKKYTGVKVEWKLVLLKPLISAVVMAVCAYGSYQLCVGLLGNSIAALVGVAAGGLVYAAMILLSGAVTPDEVAMLPKGGKLAEFLRKLTKKRV